VGVHQTNSELHDKFVEMSGGFIADETAAIEAAAERWALTYLFLTRLPDVKSGEPGNYATAPSPTADCVLAGLGINVDYKRGQIRYCHIVSEVMRIGWKSVGGRDKVFSRRKKGGTLPPCLDDRVDELLNSGITHRRTIAAHVGVSVPTTYKAVARIERRRACNL